MNVVQLQDMLRGLPDDRLKQELAQPTGTVPEYLVLSEVVRRDKLRESAASAPQSTVVQDIIGSMQPEQPMAFANGGFISPSEAMGNAGVKGFYPAQPKQKLDFGFSSSGPQMFTPNTTPQPPAPVTNNNTSTTVNLPGQPGFAKPQAQFDGGQQQTPNDPSFYEQPQTYADGGVIGLANGSLVNKIAGAESSFDPQARNPRSSAGGLGQFIDSTWIQYLNETQPGLVDRIGKAQALKLKFNADLSKDAIEWYKGKNAGVLKSAGFEPSEGNLYLAHFLGGGGAKGILGADPSTPAVNIVGEKVVKANPFLRNMSAADVIAWANNKMGSGAAPVISPASAPAPQSDQEVAGMSPIMNPADREAGILSGGVMPDAKKRGIGTFFADLMSNPDSQKGLKELGATLFAKGQEQQPVPEAPGITRGDPSLVLGIKGKSPDELIAEYRALRTGYMANGGVVKMADGPPGERVPASGLEDLVLTLNPLTGTYTDQNGKFYFRDEAEKILKQQEQLKPKFNPLTTTTVEPGGEVVPGAPELPKPDFFPGMTPAPVPPASTPPQSMGLFPDDFRATPNQLFMAERDAEKRRKAQEEADRLAAEPSAFDKYLAAYKESQEKIAQIYRDQAEEERRREAEAGGLPFLLRQLGIGMIATGGPLGQGIRGGLQQAFSAREEQTQAARDRIRELQLKGQMTELEAANELAKLSYQADVEAGKAAREGLATQKDYLAQVDDIGKLISSREDAVEAAGGDVATDPVLKQYRAIQAEIMKKAGLSGTMSEGTAGYVYVPGQGAVPR